MFEIFPIRAFSDNYIWTLLKDNEVTVVDPGDPEPVRSFLEERGLTLNSILITHHIFEINIYDNTRYIFLLPRITNYTRYLNQQIFFPHAGTHTNKVQPGWNK